MPDSIRERIRQNMATALAAESVTLPGGATLTKPAGLTVHREPQSPISDTQLPAAALLPGEEEERPIVMGRVVEDRMVEAVALVVKHGASSTPSAAVDPLLAWAQAALLADPKRGGLAKDTRVLRRTWRAEYLEQVAATAAVEVEITYWTKEQDPTALPD